MGKKTLTKTAKIGGILAAPFTAGSSLSLTAGALAAEKKARLDETREIKKEDASLVASERSLANQAEASYSAKQEEKRKRQSLNEVSASSTGSNSTLG